MGRSHQPLGGDVELREGALDPLYPLRKIGLVLHQVCSNLQEELVELIDIIQKTRTIIYKEVILSAYAIIKDIRDRQPHHGDRKGYYR